MDQGESDSVRIQMRLLDTNKNSQKSKEPPKSPLSGGLCISPPLIRGGWEGF
jgi:hypothetical protein